MLDCGIDWSDRKLDYLISNPQGDVLTEGVVPFSPEGLADLFVALEQHAKPDEIRIAVETKHGAWMQALLDRGYCVYPVNPKNVERFREALVANGDKSDRIDRRVLAQYLHTFHARLRPLQPDAPQIVSLRIACQDRVTRVEERTAKLHELRDILKAYCPVFLGLFGDLNSRIALEFLQDYPTQNAMRTLTPRRLAGWLKRRGYTHPKRIQDMTAQLQADALPVADHLQEAKAPTVRYLAAALVALNAEIEQREKDIDAAFGQLPEASQYASLPRAGENLAPALLAVFGRDPERWANAPQAQAFMGTAPVTKSSGRSRQVTFRRGCWKFARRTLYLFADTSRRACAWAQRFYEKQRATGHKHSEALRALGHKWVKILLAMQRTGTHYNEAIYQQDRQRYLLASKPVTVTNTTFSGRSLP